MVKFKKNPFSFFWCIKFTVGGRTAHLLWKVSTPPLHPLTGGYSIMYLEYVLLCKVIERGDFLKAIFVSGIKEMQL